MYVDSEARYVTITRQNDSCISSHRCTHCESGSFLLSNSRRGRVCPAERQATDVEEPHGDLGRPSTASFGHAELHIHLLVHMNTGFPRKAHPGCLQNGAMKRMELQRVIVENCAFHSSLPSDHHSPRLPAAKTVRMDISAAKEYRMFPELFLSVVQIPTS